MKKVRKIVGLLMVLMLIFPVNLISAEEEGGGVVFSGEVSVGLHSNYLDENTGEMWYREAVSTQIATISVEKEGVGGVYLQVENFTPLGSEESGETDTYLGFYTEAFGMTFDAGLGSYWAHEKEEIDYYAVYGSIDFPSVGWEIVPFVQAEYRMANQDGIAENGSRTSLDGFVYRGGIKREFEVFENITIGAEISAGGHTGIYGMPAENLSFVREKVNAKFILSDDWKIEVTALTQQNLGREYGIAVDTERLFVSAKLVWSF